MKWRNSVTSDISNSLVKHYQDRISAYTNLCKVDSELEMHLNKTETPKWIGLNLRLAVINDFFFPIFQKLELLW